MVVQPQYNLVLFEFQVSVRNMEKASASNGKSSNFPRRKTFRGDLASNWKPEVNPEPTTARGKRRREAPKRSRKAPAMLIKGLAHRPHKTPREIPSGVYVFVEGHHKLVALTKTYKKNK